MRSVGYRLPLYLLPFDHRHSYLSGVFGFAPPLTADQRVVVIDSKRLIYEGFMQALGGDLKVSTAGLLVDEEFGAGILRDARANGYITALSTEKSGSDEFEFEYGEAFRDHIAAFDPTFAKALVRYNPESDAALNQRQTARLRRLSEWCRATDRRFMFELLVPATSMQMECVNGDISAYALQVRPDLMRRTIGELHDAGIEPDVWKVEGLDHREDCARLVAIARQGGRDDVSCIVLGHGADEQKVVRWLTVAASVPGFIGFAVGRTTFWDAVCDFVQKRATRAQAVARIARRYQEWAAIFAREQGSSPEQAS